ncbi:MAG TPA: hypothetical protein VMR31_04615 [Myxococcota bacterium]|nr:hypothetical protein [Myxococcota bacterium]
MTSRVLSLALCAGLLGSAGCTTVVAKPTILSTKSSNFGQPHQRAATQASASDGRLWILILPLGGAPSIDAATNQLLDKYSGDYLTDAEISETEWSLLVISGGSMNVKGDVWKAAAPGGSAAPMK